MKITITAENTEILLAHEKRYPQLQPTDAVKLLYQNEFGGGHLIRDKEACLEYLRREYAATVHDPATPLYEEIGNGLVRVHLAALEQTRLEALGTAFLRSAEAHQGSLERFQEKLSLLSRLTEEGSFAFGPEGLSTYLTEYAKAGYPAVSHSPEYRQAYHPAYRIVRQEFLWKL